MAHFQIYIYIYGVKRKFSKIFILFKISIKHTPERSHQEPQLRSLLNFQYIYKIVFKIFQFGSADTRVYTGNNYYDNCIIF